MAPGWWSAAQSCVQPLGSVDMPARMLRTAASSVLFKGACRSRHPDPSRINAHTA